MKIKLFQYKLIPVSMAQPLRLQSLKQASLWTSAMLGRRSLHAWVISVNATED